jgi:release factor glutamine methyltransferase
LVRAVTGIIAKKGRSDAALRCLDLGTGTGAILLSLLSEWPLATGIGVDHSAEALVTARANALRHMDRFPSLSSRSSWLESDWFSAVDGVFDVIVSNPPYIAHQDLAGLAPEVLNHDPHLALDGGQDGLEAYRIILSKAAPHLALDGVLALEIGIGQGEDVRHIADRSSWMFHAALPDFGGIERVLLFERA